MQTIPTMTAAELKAYLASLPVDDEPLSPEEQAAYEQGMRDIANGDVLSTEELMAELEPDDGRQANLG